MYYIPSKDEDENNALARGKLFDKIRNLRDWMKDKGLVARKQDQKKQAKRDSKGTTFDVSPTELIDYILSQYQSQIFARGDDNTLDLNAESCS